MKKTSLLLFTLIFILSCTNMQKVNNDEHKIKLTKMLGKTGEEIITSLNIPLQKCDFPTEPPMILRGISYPYESGSISLFLAGGEPFLRKFIYKARPTCKQVLKSKISGMMLTIKDKDKFKTIYVGSVPFPWFVLQ